MNKYEMNNTVVGKLVQNVWVSIHNNMFNLNLEKLVVVMKAKNWLQMATVQVCIMKMSCGGILTGANLATIS